VRRMCVIVKCCVVMEKIVQQIAEGIHRD
ncbi:MAG: hypothetical protein EZS28_000946, partial [Streblomastix strix]